MSSLGPTIVFSVPQPPVPEQLTAAEARVARAILLGHSNKEIAAQLGCSAKTISNHLASIYRKLDVHSRDELAATLVIGDLAGASPPVEGDAT